MSSRRVPSRPKPVPTTAFLKNSDQPKRVPPAIPPKRPHSIYYHRPLLLDDNASSSSLLTWFDSISEKRQMPWRKTWPNSAAFEGSDEERRRTQARRAYEVWVSEIMLQQTRVSVVIPYFNKWIAKWPTVEDLAAASQDEVLAAWKGLGYYSRATRLHEAAQQIVNDMDGIIPADVDSLLKIKGIGRYTAGAVSSIAFGRASPLLDGNVSRVLCRQLGLHARVKEKKIDDLLWEVASVLVNGVASHETEDNVSDVPGRWNQALMELGSTICTPKPKCQECPIRSTCRVYEEGESMKAAGGGTHNSNTRAVDIEDVCSFCEPLELEEVEDAVEEVSLENSTNDSTSQGRKRSATATALVSRPAKVAKESAPKQRSLREFTAFAAIPSQPTLPAPPSKLELDTKVIAYCSIYPKREPKKKVPEEECIVCIVWRKTGAGKQYLIEQRPPKGLLASMWQFPTYSIPAKTDSTLQARKKESQKFVRSLFGRVGDCTLNLKGENEAITHIFSHLKLQMHTHLFELICDDSLAQAVVTEKAPKRLWVNRDGVDDATLGTGMRRCWEQYIGDN